MNLRFPLEAFAQLNELERLTDAVAIREAKADAERWRMTLAMIPQMVWSMAGDARLPDYYNERWYEFTGLPHGSLGGTEWKDLFHPEDRKSALAKWRAARATGETFKAQFRIRNRDGKYRWVVSRGQTELNGRKKTLRWYGTLTDVHESYLDQAALRASEHRSVKILNSIPQVI